MQTVAYTRFVLDRGLAGDRLDLESGRLAAPASVGLCPRSAAERLGRSGDAARRQSL